MVQNIQKQLPDLFNLVPLKVMEPAAVPDVGITGLAIDSRQVKPGDLFFALAGGNVDGHTYIPAAIAKGAALVIGSRSPHELDSTIAYIQVADTRQALAHLAAAFYDFPARDLTVIGVTGTDGKTTTCNLIHRILQTSGFKAGIISTVNAVIGDELIDTGFHVTTPEAHEIQHYLYMMKAAGLTHVVLEATSHGLAQERVTACEFDIGVVTNITHEHLDYHGSYQNYRAAKARLFQHLMLTPDKPTGNPRLAILNLDDSSYDFLDQFIKINSIVVSKKKMKIGETSSRCLFGSPWPFSGSGSEPVQAFSFSTGSNLLLPSGGGKTPRSGSSMRTSPGSWRPGRRRSAPSAR